MRSVVKLAVLGLGLVAPLARGESLFDFEAIASGTAVPFALSANGLTASFSGNAAVCTANGLSGAMFVSLSGNAIMQGFCAGNGGGPLTVNFSSDLSKVSFALAINGTTTVPVTVQFLENGTVVNTQVVQPVVPEGSLSPEAAVTYSGQFNGMVLTSAGLLAVDNVDAIPGQ